MNNIKTFLVSWVDHVASEKKTGMSSSLKFLKKSADVTDNEGDAFFTAVADYVGQIGLTNGKYDALRDYAKESPDQAKKLFNSITPALRELADVPPVGMAIRKFEFAQQKAEIIEDIAAVKTFRAAFTSADKKEQRAVKRALKAGIEDLRDERDNLQDRNNKKRRQANQSK